MSEVVKNDSIQLHGVVTDLMIKDYLFGSNTKLAENQQVMFLNIAKSFNLNPFKREIYAVKYLDQFNIVTGYQIYIERAVASGQLDGWNVKTIRNDNGVCIGASITIHRKDFKYPFEWEVTRSEFDKRKSIWLTMPEFMTKKVAIGQGFRLAFPNELGGMPYLAEEITDQKFENLEQLQKKEEEEAKSVAEKLEILRAEALAEFQRETSKSPAEILYGNDMKITPVKEESYDDLDGALELAGEELYYKDWAQIKIDDGIDSMPIDKKKAKILHYKNTLKRAKEIKLPEIENLISKIMEKDDRNHKNILIIRNHRPDNEKVIITSKLGDRLANV